MIPFEIPRSSTYKAQVKTASLALAMGIPHGWRVVRAYRTPDIMAIRNAVAKRAQRIRSGQGRNGYFPEPPKHGIAQRVDFDEKLGGEL